MIANLSLIVGSIPCLARSRPIIDSEPEFGNTFAYFEFDSPDGAQLISHQFTAKISQLDWDVDYEIGGAP